MSYVNDNISLIRANTNTTSFDAGIINENTSDAYANLIYPAILDNGGNQEIVSLTIDIFNKTELEEATQDLVNKDWAKEARLRNDLSTAKAIWGFKEAFHGVKKSRALSNAFCFGGQQLTFYIAPEGHGTGNTDNRWLYCKTSISITTIDIVNGTETVLKTFDDFESNKDDASRYFTWDVPSTSQTAFNNYGLFGLVVLRLDVTETYYEDAQWLKLYTGSTPNVNQAHLQLLVYSGAKEIIEVGVGDLNILTSTPLYTDLLEDIFDNTVFSALDALNFNALTDAQKRAIIADQIAVIFISQHPVLTADYTPSSIIGIGANEAIEPRKVLARAITYSKRYPKIVPMVKDRLFGMFATYKSFNFALDIEALISDHTQSSQVTRDPVRAILMDSEGILSDDLGENGIIFDPFAIEVKNAEIIRYNPEPLALDLDLFEGLVDLQNIEITDSSGNPLQPYDTQVLVSFGTVYGSENINRIRYSAFTRDSLNYNTYLDETGLTTSHVLDFDGVIVLDPTSNGDIVTAQIDVEDVEGGITSFVKTEGIDGYDESRPFLYGLKIYQRNDGSDVVDVYYVYDGEGEINEAYVYAEFSSDSGVTWSNVASTSMTGDFGSDIMPGRRKVSWQPAIDLDGVTVTGTVLCRITLYDADLKVAQGESVTGALVWDISQPEVAIRKLSIEAHKGMLESSTSSFSSSSSSSSSEMYSSSSSSIDSSSSSSSLSSDSSSSSSQSSESSSSSSEMYSLSSSSSSIDSSSSSSSVQYSSSSEKYSSSSSSIDSSSSSEGYSSSSSSSSSSLYETYCLTGAITPDATGTYRYGGMFEGFPYYQNGTYYLFCDDVANDWMIDDTLARTYTPLWAYALAPNEDPYPPLGDYVSLVGSTGTGVLTIGGC